MSNSTTYENEIKKRRELLSSLVKKHEVTMEKLVEILNEVEIEMVRVIIEQKFTK